MSSVVLPEDLLELRDDLWRERRRLGRLVGSLAELLPRLGEGPEPVEVAALRLQEYLRFRHLVRNLYADELRPEPIATLLRELPEVWEALEQDLNAFEAWAAGVAHDASQPPAL